MSSNWWKSRSAVPLPAGRVDPAGPRTPRGRDGAHDHRHRAAAAPDAAARDPSGARCAPEPATDPPEDQDEQTQPPVFRAEINFVRVDVIVTDDDDNLVLDLTPEDFEIYEDDTLQTIETFELIEITGEPDPALPPPSSIRNEYDQEREAARSDSRIFVFFPRRIPRA